MNINTPYSMEPYFSSGIGARVVVTLISGIIVALFLTWFMYVLIQSSEQKLDDSKRVHMLDFVRLKREEASQRMEQKPERPKMDEAPPAPETPQDSTASDVDALAVSAMPAATEMDIGSSFSFGAGEGEYLPIVKVAPIYPASAASKGTEGYCLVQYTVTTNGSTKDVEVVDGECTNAAFRRPSIIAAQKFKYKPRVVNGEAIEVLGVKNRFTYVLDKSNGNGDAQ